jgi:hypothetical protein
MKNTKFRARTHRPRRGMGKRGGAKGGASANNEIVLNSSRGTFKFTKVLAAQSFRVPPTRAHLPRLHPWP